VYSESLSDDDQFQNRTLAALVASKVRSDPFRSRVSPSAYALPLLLFQVYYHLEELNEALKYALSAGDLFDVNAKNEYVETLLGTYVIRFSCIDQYVIGRRSFLWIVLTQPSASTSTSPFKSSLTNPNSFQKTRQSCLDAWSPS